MGNGTGLTPTALSQTQRVSKNTISSLLRGLEAQGFIRRTLDADDLRTFRIQLTPAGRAYLRSTAPGRMEELNRFLSGLSLEEKGQLTALLEKLQRTLLAKYHSTCKGAMPCAEGGPQTSATEERING
jgi:DNA-binding MarR family transcriptional regulator